MVEQLIPLGNKIVIKPLKAGEKTKSGLYIPSDGKGDACHAVVVSLGKGYVNKNGDRIPMKYKVGDVVLYGRNTGQEYFLNDCKHFIITEDDVVAIYRGKKDLTNE